MKQYIPNPITRALGIALISTAGLYGLVSPTTAQAGIYPGLDNELCMADAYLLEPGNSLPQGKLNCTANDVEITQVVPVDPNQECTLGQTFTFDANVTVRTNANERYDTTFYLPLTEQSPQVVQGGADNCSLVLPIPDDEPGQIADVDIDSDQCGDITKALGPDQYTLSNESITMLCIDEDGDNRADFTYCAAWDNQERDNCTVAADPYPGQIPNTKSKCNCDTFNIDVFIKPDPPVLIKSEGTPNTRPEPGGDYSFDFSFKNESKASLFLTSVTDWVDIGGEGSYDQSLDLWGSTTTVNPALITTAEGVYLKSTTCTQPPDIGNGIGEIPPEATYSCSFTVTIVDRDLPDDQSPEFYKDAVQVTLEDANGDPVVDGSSCSAAGLSSNPGEHCSVVRTVQVTNVAPTITVTKTPDPAEVLENGGEVTFTVLVTSTSGNYDDPLTISSISDTVFGTLPPGTDVLSNNCATGTSVYLATPYTCSFTALIEGNAGDVHTNTITVQATDNESDVAQNSGSATVNINDVPSAIRLEKTADPIEVFETGDDPTVFRDVAYTFRISVEDGGAVDDVSFYSLDDDQFGELAGDCTIVESSDPDLIPLLPIALTDGNTWLSPGEYATCAPITKQLQGNAGDVHTNVATVYGVDEDGQQVDWSDNAVVTFLNADLDMEQEFAMKAIAFVRITNGNVDTAEITTLTIKGVNLVAGGGIPGEFEVLNEAGTSSYNPGDGPYAFCSTGVFIAPKETYECAFSLKLFPGFIPLGNIEFLATGVNGLVFTFEDDEGNPVTTDVDIAIQTQE